MGQHYKLEQYQNIKDGNKMREWTQEDLNKRKEYLLKEKPKQNK